MPNILDYIKEYGSCAFYQMPFSSVDSLILTQLSYIKYADLFYKEKERYENGEITLKEASHLLKLGNLSSGILGTIEDEALFLAAANSKRFGNIKIWNYVNYVDAEKETQFSVVTFIVDEQNAYIAFRGTDSHLLGWKEDLKLAFQEVMLSQKIAHKYLEAVGMTFWGKIYVGGHSKGGTLAAYASFFLDDEVKNKIIHIYCFDTPQINEMHGQIEDKLIRIVPKDSLVGLLFGNLENHIVVDSDKKGLWQHDPYSWQIQNGGFVYLLSLRERAMRTGKTFNSWVVELSLEEKQRVAETFYALVEMALADTTENDLKERKRMDALLGIVQSKKYGVRASGLKMLRLYIRVTKEARAGIKKRKKENKQVILNKLRYILENIGKNS